MDMFVPSMGMPSSSYGAGLHSSIYDSDKSEITAICDVPPAFSTSGMDDFYSLDESLEDSTLKSYLTPDVLSSLKVPAQDSCSSSDNPWPVKFNKVNVRASCSTGSVGPNPTLAQLNAGFFPVDDILSADQEASKQSDASFDCFYNDVKPSPGFRLDSQFQLSPSPVALNQSPAAVVVSSSHGNFIGRSTPSDVDTLSNFGNSYMRNMPLMKTLYFPPRQSNPSVGVVAPVKQPEPLPSQSQSLPIKKEQNINQPTLPRSNSGLLLQELLGKSSSAMPIKPEPTSLTKPATLSKQNFPMFQSRPTGEAQSQIVPTSDSRKRDSSGAPKTQSGQPIKKETDEETWKDIVTMIGEDTDFERAAKRMRKDSGSSGHMSNDEEDDDEDNRSLYGDNNGADDSDDDMSDIDADLTHVLPGQQESLIPPPHVTVGSKKQNKPIQYFWQYNVQAKGPKGTRLKLAVESPADPHILNDFEDPVFDVCNTSIAGIRHGGKARKGDGNEITPNPRKLYLIGLQLARLNKKINACCQQINCPNDSGVSAAQRNESRKEKNKLASRACRLKKKAQHEANKIKLHGLALEHRQLNVVSKDVWSQLRERVQASLARSSQQTDVSKPRQSLTSSVGQRIDNILDHKEVQVAGHSIDYVNSVILKVEAGDSDGGLSINKRRQQKSS